ncbi:site-specific integrase [Mucilaginibacter gynuensis]|uniref:Site-specific integrase n=1 Tax=Mucilaginibacter gynuensis TaxID=1302236 RepID=A0ABP8HN71_9SPHI
MSKNFGQSLSFKVVAQAHTRADGTNTIYLRVIIDQAKKEYNLKVFWPKAHFDETKQEALPRHKNDMDVASVNMVINEAKGRANRIKIRYFGENKPLTLDLFTREFENYESRDNFIFYWTNKINEKFASGELGSSTVTRHNTNLERFKEFANCGDFFSISDIRPELILKYQAWLRKKLKYNTVVNALKTLQTYLNAASADGFSVEDPFVKIKLKYVAGEREVLERDELKRLQKLFLEPDMPEIMREVLRKFLFSCFTGLRVSDSAQLHRKMIVKNILRVKLVKGENFGKEVQIPLPDYAISLIEGRKGQLFKAIADQTCNDWLKIIAKDAKIEKSLSFHVSRDTFATLFIEMGGDVFTLKELLGHSDIKTTMIYVKMSENRKGVLMNNFNNL